MTGQSPRSIGIATLLCLLLALTLVLVLSSDGAEAQTNPPSSGDWNIYDATTLSNQRVNVPGSLTIYSGGSLSLSNVDLVFNHASWGSKTLRVRNGGQLSMTGGSITHTSPSYSYQFIVESGATVSMDGTTVSHTWHDSRTQIGNQDLAGGMQIKSHTVTITNCTFQFSERVAMVIDNVNPKITGTTFSKVAYYTYYRSSSYLDREAYGIIVINGAPEITGCTFNELGDYDTAYNDATSYYYTYLRLMGHGVYVIRGAPKIKECTFTEIGRIHSSSSLYINVPGYGYVRFYFYRQDYRGAVHAIDPVMMEVTWCNFTSNYQGYYYYTSQGFGVYQNDGKSSIKNNEFWTNGGGCVMVSEGDIVLRNNFMSDFFYYGLYIQGKGSITAQNNTFNGTGENRNVRNEYAVNIYNGGGAIDMRENRVSFCQRAFYITDTNLVKIYDTLVTNCSKKVYANAARVDLYNVSVARAEIELGYTNAEVNIYWKLEVLVTWQNGVPIPGAIVQVFNESNGLLKTNLVDNRGLMPVIYLLQTKVTGTYQGTTSLVNSPLKISAYANAIESKLYTVPFDKNTWFNCLVEDAIPPNVEIYRPSSNHAQNSTALRLFGIAVDVGSGLDGVVVSSDGGETWTRAEGSLQWDLTIELPEGVYELLVRGVDRAGAYKEYVLRNVTIDLTEPWLIITTPVRNNFHTNQTTVTIIGQAEIGSRVYLNGNELGTTGGSFFAQLVNQQEGQNTYEVMAVDHVGNRNVTLLTIHQDITPPILLIEHPTEQYVTNERVLEISGLTEKNVTVTIGDLEVNVENGLFTMPLTLKEGLNVVEISAVDMALNFKHVTLRVTYDITPPQLDMEYPVRDGAVNKSTVTVEGRVPADVSEVLVNLVPVVIRQGAFSKSFKLSEGDNRITIKATDMAGNSVSRSFVLTLDTVLPTLVLDGPEDGIYATTETVQVSGRTDVGAIVTINDEEVDVVGGYFIHEITLVETVPGGAPNLLVIKALDEVGNEVSETRHIYRDTKAPRFVVYDVKGSTTSDFINITGGVEEVSDVAEMSINNIPIQPSSKGYFEAYVPLDMGVNVFVITATDAAGNEYTQQVMVEREPRKVADTGFLGLGGSAWLIMVLMLLVGLFGGLAVLYMLERRKGVLA